MERACKLFFSGQRTLVAFRLRKLNFISVESGECSIFNIQLKLIVEINYFLK